ncbi:unnamed protein product [Colias eurytheme]|nr:unnamed protein product [Colias eurytheme]
MKSLTVLLFAGICASAVGFLIKVPVTPARPKIASFGWVHIQKIMLPLFENVCEDSSNPLIKRLSEEFNLDASDYLKANVVENLQGIKSGKGLLAKGEIFTETNIDHFNELRAIYEVLYYAKDFDTFYKAACWARQNVNCGVFVDAIYMALVTRKDIERVSVPAPYELLPNYFVRKDFIIKASSIMSGADVSSIDGIREDGNAYIIDANYTCTDYEETEESKLAYFHEDVGLNSYFFLTNLKYLPWVDTEFQRSTRYGEHIYHFMKQLMTRYHLERYSNGLYELEGIDWDDMDVTPYDPVLIYSNGKEFCARTSTGVKNIDLISSLKNIEHNIATTVTHMRDGGYSKPAILNNLMEILVTNNNSYLNLAMQAVSNDAAVNSSPSALSHYMTIIRDPIFWKINKKMVDLVNNALKVLPCYSKNQLYFPGVQVTNIDVKKMITSFDNYEFDVTDALKYGDKDPNFQIKFSQTRLNHKPFAIKVNVSSLVVQKGLVKVYLGPKVMPGDIAEKRKLFLLIDSFEVNLKKGSNIITRTSDEINNISEDFTPLDTIRKGVVDSEFGVDALSLKSVKSQIGFPTRLILPKGSTDGLPFQIFVIVAPYVKAVQGGSKTNIELNYDAILSPGYPLDLDIEIQEIFNLPNALVKDIIITNKIDSKPSTYGRDGSNYGGEQKWQNVNYQEKEIVTDPLALVARPEFTMKKDQTDYKSRKGQYGKKEESVVANDQMKFDEADKTDVIKTNRLALASKSEFTIKKDQSDYKSSKGFFSKKYDFEADARDPIVTKKDDGTDMRKDVEINKVVTFKDDKGDDFEYNVIKDYENLNKFHKIVKDQVKEFKEKDGVDTVIEKDIDVTVEPKRLLQSTKKRYPTIFNIILKPPQFTFDDSSIEKVYE